MYNIVTMTLIKVLWLSTHNVALPANVSKANDNFILTSRNYVCYCAHVGFVRPRNAYT